MSSKLKCLAFAVALGFFAGDAQGDKPKTCQIRISTVSKIGTHELQPGDYRVAVHMHDPKPMAHFTNLQTGDEFQLEAKVEVVGEKFDNTEVHADTVDGVKQIREIRIGGSRTRVVFDK